MRAGFGGVMLVALIVQVEEYLKKVLEEKRINIDARGSKKKVLIVSIIFRHLQDSNLRSRRNCLDMDSQSSCLRALREST